MRINVDPSIPTGEESGASDNSYELIASDNRLRFAAQAATTNALLDIAIPQSYARKNASQIVYAAWRNTDGNARIRAINIATNADWALSATNSVVISAPSAYQAIRNAVFTDASNNSWVYTATHGTTAGSGVQVRRASLTGTTNPLTVTFSNFGPAFGPARSDTSTLLRRVEAVCPTDDGVIVAVGTHDYTNDFSTIQFWRVLADGSAAYPLQNFIQMGFTEVYSSTPYYSAAKYACLISAIYNPTTKAITVLANAHPQGQPVIFTIQNGVESAIQVLGNVDPVYGSISFIPYSLASIGGIYYMPCRYVYTQSDGSTLAYDCYLTSLDAVLWSMGERNFRLCTPPVYGTLLIDPTVAPALIYYGGNLRTYTAEATPEQGYNTATRQVTLNIDDDLGFNQTTGGACTGTFSVDNSNGEAEGNSVLRGGSSLLFRTGQSGVNADIAVLNLDSPGTKNTPDGSDSMAIEVSDAGNKALNRHSVLTDLDVWSLDSVATDLDTADALVIKTPTDDVLTLDPTKTNDANPLDYDIVLDGTNGLKVKSLNKPFIAYIDLVESSAQMMRARVKFPDTGDLYALPAFAFLLGASDTGNFNGVIIPKNHTWVPVGTTATTGQPRVVRSNLKPFNTADNTGGFNFEAAWQGLWVSNNYNAADANLKYLQAVLEQPAHYSLNSAFVAAAGADNDYVMWRHGRRVVLYQRTHDYAAATMASHAGFTRLLDYRFDDDTFLDRPERTRLGIAANADVLSLKGVGLGLGDKIEAALTSADEDHSAFGTLYASFDNGRYQSGTNSFCHVYNYSGSGVTFTSGEVIGVLWGGWTEEVRVVSYTPDDAYSGTLVITGRTFPSNSPWAAGTMPTGGIFVRNASDTWAYADSSYRTYNVSGGSVQYTPFATKIMENYGGRGAFFTDDATGLTMRHILSNGTHHILASGSPAQQKGFDPFWPGLNNNAFASSWRCILRPNLIYAGWLSDLNLGTSGFMKTSEGEIIRWVQYSFNKPGHGNTAVIKWTEIATFYSALARQVAGLNTLTQYNNGSVAIGDDWTTIGSFTPIAGLRVEISSKTGGSSKLPLYAVSVAAAPSGLGGVLTLSSTLDTIVQQHGDYGSDSGDVSTLDGRMQLGTKLGAHDPDYALCHYPAPVTATSQIDSLITVSHLEAYSGLRMSVEDTLKYLCKLAGVHRPAFRSLMTGAYAKAAYPLTLTATAQALPLVGNLSDFVIDAQIHISAAQWLQIDFRTANNSAAYYRLAIKETSTGAVTVGLQAIGSSITAGGLDTKKWLIYAEFPIAPAVICPTSADRVHLKASVQGSLVSVEINGLPTLSVDLSEIVHSDGTSYNISGAWGIYLSYSGTVTGNSCSVWVPELWAEVKTQTVSMGTNMASVIKKLCNKYGIIPRITQDGGVMFSQFVTRDVGLTMTRGIKEHARDTDDTYAVAQVIVTGDNSGGYIDGAFADEEGFSLAVVSGNEVQTVQQAQTIAQLQSRESVEFRTQETLSARARISLECEDVVPIVYAPPGDAPALPLGYYAITSISWKIQNDFLMMTVKARGYKAWT